MSHPLQQMQRFSIKLRVPQGGSVTTSSDIKSDLLQDRSQSVLLRDETTVGAPHAESANQEDADEQSLSGEHRPAAGDKGPRGGMGQAILGKDFGLKPPIDSSGARRTVRSWTTSRRKSAR